MSRTNAGAACLPMIAFGQSTETVTAACLHALQCKLDPSTQLSQAPAQGVPFALHLTCVVIHHKANCPW